VAEGSPEANDGLPGLSVTVGAARGEKCVRCWTYAEDRGKDPGHPELCGRCAEAV
ncbi:MAG: hypothetical protein HY901_21920, partial [Deltaproteobacteria bacterium]|nr:hypothetical protein [Deltaproteobacteria bacterium]